MTNYLRFADQATWETLATEAGFRIETSVPSEADPTVLENKWTWLYYTHEWSIDDVGAVYLNDAVIDPETGTVITPPTLLNGWHVNFIGTLPDGWDQYLVHPTAPYRVFA
jgi:hypothetical protein